MRVSGERMGWYPEDVSRTLLNHQDLFSQVINSEFPLLMPTRQSRIHASPSFCSHGQPLDTSNFTWSCAAPLAQLSNALRVMSCHEEVQTTEEPGQKTAEFQLLPLMHYCRNISKQKICFLVLICLMAWTVPTVATYFFFIIIFCEEICLLKTLILSVIFGGGRPFPNHVIFVCHGLHCFSLINLRMRDIWPSRFEFNFLVGWGLSYSHQVSPARVTQHNSWHRADHTLML